MTSPDNQRIGGSAQPLPDKCGARLTDGSGRYCTQPRGWRTDHPGYGQCRWHGGTTPNGGKSAEKERLLGEVGTLMVELDLPDTDAITALGEALRLSRKMAAVHEVLVAELDDILGHNRFGERTRHPLEVALGDWTDRKARVSKLAIDAGLEERRVQLEEHEGQAVARLIVQLLDDAGLGLTDEQRAAGRLLAARLLRQLAAVDADSREVAG